LLLKERKGRAKSTPQNENEAAAREGEPAVKKGNPRIEEDTRRPFENHGWRKEANLNSEFKKGKPLILAIWGFCW